MTTAREQIKSLIYTGQMLHPPDVEATGEMIASTKYVMDYVDRAVSSVAATGLPPQIDGGTF